MPVLILPADAAWNEATVKGPVVAPPAFAAPDPAAVEAATKALGFAKKPVLLLGSGACGEAALAAAGRLAAHGVRVLTDTFTARQARGEGRFRPDKLPYFAEQALKDLDGVDLMILVSTQRPVAFFAYPDRPSVLTPEGWLVLYHAMSEGEGHRYKLGAMLLDLDDPTKVLHRAVAPVLSPDEPYENHGKPGIIYSCGAVVRGDMLYVYYGGADKVVCVATAALTPFLTALIKGHRAALSPISTRSR